MLEFELFEIVDVYTRVHLLEVTVLKHSQKHRTDTESREQSVAQSDLMSSQIDVVPTGAE